MDQKLNSPSIWTINEIPNLIRIISLVSEMKPGKTLWMSRNVSFTDSSTVLNFFHLPIQLGTPSRPCIYLPFEEKDKQL